MIESRPNNYLPINERRKSPPRLTFFLGLDLLRQVKTDKVDLVGKERLEKLPGNKAVIFATTHLSDTDVPLASYVLSKCFDIGITHSSTHNPKENIGVYIETLIAGRDNFYSIKHKVVNGRETGIFDPKNFEKMEQAVVKGKSLVIASSYNPKDTKPQQIGAELPKNLGYAAIYLAHKINAVVVPVAVNLKPQIKGRPEAEVLIGSPLELSQLELDSFDNSLTKEERLTPEEFADFRKTKSVLKKESEFLTRSLAQMLPEEKRGVWNSSFERHDDRQQPKE